MKLIMNSVVGLFTNLRWDWLKLNFYSVIYGEGGKVKSDFHDKGGRGGKAKSDFGAEGERGGVNQKVIFDYEGGGGVKTPLKKMTSFMNSP